MDVSGGLVITLAAGIIIAWATAFFTSKYYASHTKADLQKELESRFNERKWETYTGFADTVRRVFQSGKNERLTRDMPKLLSEMYDFIGKLWLVGSDDVVHAFAGWQRYNWSVGEEGYKAGEGLSRLANILIEMRKDLGYKTSTIDAKDLLKTFVKDIDDYVP